MRPAGGGARKQFPTERNDYMKLRMETIQRTLVVKIEGEVDHHTAEEMRTEIDREINLHNVQNLIFDFDKVTFMDSSGIGVIIGRYKQIHSRGGKTLIIRVKPQVDRILEISGIKKIIDTNGKKLPEKEIAL